MRSPPLELQQSIDAMGGAEVLGVPALVAPVVFEVVIGGTRLRMTWGAVFLPVILIERSE